MPTEALGGGDVDPTDEPTTDEPTTDEPTDPTDGECSASIDIVNDWGSGWQANVSVTAGSDGIDGWTLNWTWPSGQGISSHWNADVSTSGSSVTAGDVGWNGNVAAGQTINAWGFIGMGSAAAPEVTCTAA